MSTIGQPELATQNRANAFFRVAFMESWGRGIDLIRNVCRAAGKPEPAFRWDNGLWVEFALQEARTLVETPGKTPGKTPARILELLQKNPNLTVPDIALQISKSESAVQRGILKLQIAGRLKRAGSRKSGYWEVLK
jgi:ATP-dependent DNA helicase RecG